jgi:hypothetical protein
MLLIKYNITISVIFCQGKSEKKLHVSKKIICGIKNKACLKKFAGRLP